MKKFSTNPSHTSPLSLGEGLGERHLYLIDSTLRDGEQAPGVVFGLNEKITIASMLDKIGIEELEIGSPFISEHDLLMVKKLVSYKFSFRCSCWSRAKIEDIDAAAKTGATGINISYPVSDIQLLSMGKNRQWVLESMPEIVSYAKKRFQYVSLGAQDASRADKKFLHSYLKMAKKLEVYRVRIADTVGCLNPLTTRSLIKDVVSKVKNSNLQIEFHGHNDLGMATANSISAIQAGADCVSATINGLGERAGNAALEEVIMALKISMGIQIPYSTEGLNELCSFTAEASGRKLPADKPIVGEMTHRHESGIHTNCMLRDKRAYEPFDAREVGKSGSSFVFGIHSGSNALNSLLEKNSINLDKQKLQELLKKVKTTAVCKRRSLTDAEVLLLSDSYR